VAPQYMKYVEKGRRTADMNSARSILEALTIAYAGGDIEFPSSRTNTGCRTSVVVSMNQSGLMYITSGTVLINGKDYTQDGRPYERVIQMLNSYGVDTDTTKLQCKKTTDNGWAFFSVILYSDGTTRIASGVNDDSASYNGATGNKNNYERNTDWWYSAGGSNIEKAMGLK